MKRILVYSHDTFGLGNIRRMLAIATHLVEAHEELSVLIVSGSPMLHAFRIPPRIDYLKLPCLARSPNGEYGVKFLDMPFDATVRLRTNLLVSALIDFDPDLVLVDKKPLGVGNELAPALELLQRRGRCPRLVLLLRDILDSPEATRSVWGKNGYFDAIDRYYDQVLVVGSESIFDLAAEYEFPDDARRKVRYCGYLRRTRPGSGASLRTTFAAPDEQLVLVTAGGGEDGVRLMSTYAQALDRIAGPGGVRSVMVCGPEMAANERAVIRRRLDGRTDVHVLEFSDDMLGLMEASDLVVSMSGYNTVCELLSLRKRAILVPRVRPVLEQWIRARRLAHHGLATAIHPDTLTPDGLAETVLSELDRTNVLRGPMYQLDLDGLERVAESIGNLLETDGARRRPDRRVALGAVWS